MKNQQIADIFNEMADILELSAENVFRIRAYRRAGQSIAALSRDVATLSPAELETIPGIGKDLAAKVREFLTTGKIAKHEELKARVPAGFLELLRVPGLGPKKAKLFAEKLKVKGVRDLEAAIRAGRLRGLPGIRKKTEENILKGIELLNRGAERRPLGRVLPLAEQIMGQLRQKAAVGRIEAAGSIRRRKDTVKDIDILATSKDPAGVMAAFVKLPQAERVLAHGETKSSIITDDGIQVDLRVVDEDTFGAALQYFTGSKQHNIRLREMAVRAGLKISEYGVFRERGGTRIGGRKEEDIYQALKLPFIPPELREDSGEIEAALEGRLPRLVEPGDIRGDLHVHTKASDGSLDLETLVQEARKRGYGYIAVTDHTKGLGVAHGLDEERLREQGKLIARTNSRLKGFTVLAGSEVDIRSDGKLDLPDSVLGGLDIVAASIHSGFRQTREQLTRRLIAAVRSPVVNVIAHPTGRLINERDAYDVDLEAVLKEAAKFGVAMEINACPLRLDLNDIHVRMAKGYGVPIVISTDTHAANQFDYMAYGVSVARRGWLEKEDVLNTLECGQLVQRLKACRAKKGKTP